jgi:predicted ATP-dependent endonuclease of OLD family
VRLLEVRVRSFRCIEDSGAFSLGDVTCLVGKNESGKTAILKALHKLKPENEALERFEPGRDYPRRRWRPGTAVPHNPPVISTTWRLTDAEHAGLEERFGRGTLPGKEFTLSKSYDNERQYDITVSEKAVVKHFVTEAKLNAGERKPIADAQTMDAIVKGLEMLTAPTEAQQNLLQLLDAEFAHGVEEAVIAALDDLVPTFL